MLAAIFQFFCEEGCPNTEAYTTEMLSKLLLNQRESARLCRMDKRDHPTVTLIWAMKVWILACRSLGVAASTEKSVIDRLLHVMERERQIKSILGCPIPFGYFHLLNMMVLANLLLWAYYMALDDSIVVSLVFFLAMLFFLGMLRLASMLADPYGNDPVDFPVAHWLHVLLHSLQTIENAQAVDCSGEGPWQDLIDNEKPLWDGLASLTGRTGEDAASRTECATSTPRTLNPPRLRNGYTALLGQGHTSQARRARARNKSDEKHLAHPVGSQPSHNEDDDVDVDVDDE